MKHLLKAIPIPLGGLMLGTVAIAKLFFLMQVNAPANLFFVIGLLFFTLLVCKSIFTFKDVLQDLKNPVIASVTPTITMGAMIIASVFTLKDTAILFANGLWLVASIVQLIVVIYFVIRFVIQADVVLNAVLPSWFVTFVGIGMMPVTAPEFAKAYTTPIFYIATTLFVILLPVVLKRVFVKRDLPIATKPMITILTAPASLTLLAYIVHFEMPNTTLITILVILSQLLYFIVLYELQTLIKMPFFPSFGAFTFPLIITTTALYTANDFIGEKFEWLEIVVYFELIIATVITCYVIVVYIRYIAMQMKLQNRKQIVGEEANNSVK